MDYILLALTLAAALGSGLMAGVFFAFSTFVMKALRQLPPATGIAAMQSINIVVLNTTFLGAFVGTALISGVAALGALTRWKLSIAAGIGIGAVLYVMGTFAVTMVFNVPLNNALAAISPTDSASEQHWADYVRRWTVWNHVRTLAALAAAGAYSIAMLNFEA